jgi:hypothetical protein
LLDNDDPIDPDCDELELNELKLLELPWELLDPCELLDMLLELS